MISKIKIDRRLKKYIKEHSDKGYSKKAIRKVLTEHGYEENYIDVLVKKDSEAKFVKRYGVAIIALFFIAALFFRPQITGMVVSAEENKYIALNINYQDGAIKLNNLKITTAKDVIGENKGSFLFMALAKDDEILSETHQEMQANGDYIVYITYKSNMEKIEVYDSNKTKLFEIKISSKVLDGMY